MTEEKKYPIYEFKAKWDQDDFQGNFSSSSYMFKKPLSPLEINNKLHEWFNGLMTSPRDIGDKKPFIEKSPQLLELSASYLEHNTWCLRWFSHITFNQFENEVEAFNSFGRFVEEKTPLDIEGKYCLMGGRDQWRWKLCGCDKCKIEGITAILH